MVSVFFYSKQIRDRIMDNNFSSYEITNGVLYKTTRNVCLNPKTFIKSLLDGTFIPIGKLSGNLTIGSLGSEAIICKKMEKFELNMAFSVITSSIDNELVTTHKPTITEGTPVVAEWIPPAWMSVFMVRYKGISHLIAVENEEKRLVQIPFPNSYDTGKLCTGTLEITARNEEIDSLFEQQIAAWSKNQFNGDLFGHYNEKYLWKINALERLVRYDEGMEQLPPLTEVGELPSLTPEVDADIIKFAMEGY